MNTEHVGARPIGVGSALRVTCGTDPSDSVVSDQHGGPSSGSFEQDGDETTPAITKIGDVATPAMGAPVLIVGGGPTGMTLALELSLHGVKSIVAEMLYERCSSLPQRRFAPTGMRQLPGCVDCRERAAWQSPHSKA